MVPALAANSYPFEANFSSSCRRVTNFMCLGMYPSIS
jgi:hypothetical protein